MADKNTWRGLDDASKVAVILELVLDALDPLIAGDIAAAVTTEVDTLTEAKVKTLLGRFGGRLNRAQYGT